MNLFRDWTASTATERTVNAVLRLFGGIATLTDMASTNGSGDGIDPKPLWLPMLAAAR